jgi:two-component system nitrate/nitrite sensor histidine kinase NarX
VFLFRWGVTTLIVGVGFGLIFFLFPPGNLETIELLFALLILVIGGLANLLIGHAHSSLESRSGLEIEIRDLQSRLAVYQSRLGMAGRINKLLAEGEDERALMEQLLAELTGWVSAAGASYVPLDEWGQALTTIQHGETTPKALETGLTDLSVDNAQWLSRLGSNEVRKICGECQTLHAEIGCACPLGHNPFLKTGTIECFRIQRGEKSLGVISLFLPAEKPLEDHHRQFLDGVLGEIGIAVENLRMRSQELATLRQVQLVRSSETDRFAALSGLLAGISHLIGADWMGVYIRATYRQPARWIVQPVDLDQETDPAVQRLVERVLEAGLPHQGSSPAYPNFRGIPIHTPDRPPLGVLMVGFRHPISLSPAQMRLLETVAAEAALVLESETQLLEMEYRVVIQERSRLAREIHDGLAQTLAYLKLQVTQMNNFLARGEHGRLEEALRSSLTALSEAYLDTRQAIDHLRLKPEDGLTQWLTQAGADFRQISRVETQVTILAEPADLAPEIQVQMIRVVQEALNNVRKHAQASQVSITLREWQGDYLLEVVDNGQGFMPDDIPGLSQYGLRGMRERAELIGADFQIISQPNQGTIVRLRLPHPLEETPV